MGAEQNHQPERQGTRSVARQEKATEMSVGKSSTERCLEGHTRPLGGLGGDGAINICLKTLELLQIAHVPFHLKTSVKITQHFIIRNKCYI